jgi:hypothetical protein
MLFRLKVLLRLEEILEVIRVTEKQEVIRVTEGLLEVRRKISSWAVRPVIRVMKGGFMMDNTGKMSAFLLE